MKYEVADALSPFYFLPYTFYLLPLTFSSAKCYLLKTSQFVA